MEPRNEQRVTKTNSNKRDQEKVCRNAQQY